MKQIAFIGLGVMGGPMAGHLLDAGYDMHVYTRTREKALPLIERGAFWHDTVASCVADADAVVTIVGFPPDVEAVYFGADGIIENAKSGALLIDMTTTAPSLSVRIYEAAKARGLYALDAPVSGGDVGAKNATLSIMAGGDPAAFERALPLLQRLGSSVRHTGAAGSGQHTKMANQIAICGAIAGVCEALTYAKKAGLDPENMLACISGGAAGSWQLSNMAPRILKGDLNPGFFIKHQVKDLRIARAEAQENGAKLPVLDLVADLYERLLSDGDGELGTQALIKAYAD
jgi:3-hydroxyisobutyrate dehydrogenase-like beta-hydroxyacid dehydrogenase